MKKYGVLLISVASLLLGVAAAQSAPIHDGPGTTPDSDDGLTRGAVFDMGNGADILDQLGLMDMVQEGFFRFSEKKQVGSGPKSPRYGVDLYTIGLGGIRPSIPGFDRGTPFDQGAPFDQGVQFDEGATPDKGTRFYKGAGFDALRGFDRESPIRARQKGGRDSLGVRPDEEFEVEEEEEETVFLKSRSQGREESGPETADRSADLLSPEKNASKQELLKEDDLSLNTFRSVERGFFIKLAMFSVALLALLAATLKGLIPFKFYFFLTILILILWNPMESLFISIIVGLAALFASIFG